VKGGFVVEASYVGSRATHLGVSRNINYIPASYLSRLPTRDVATINFLGAQFRLRFLQTGLQFGLFALQRALAAARVVDSGLQTFQRLTEFEDLILASENRRRRATVPLPVQITARVNAVAIQEFATARDEIKLAFRLAPGGCRGCGG